MTKARKGSLIIRWAMRHIIIWFCWPIFLCCCIVFIPEVQTQGWGNHFHIHICPSQTKPQITLYTLWKKNVSSLQSYKYNQRYTRLCQGQRSPPQHAEQCCALNTCSTSWCSSNNVTVPSSCRVVWFALRLPPWKDKKITLFIWTDYSLTRWYFFFLLFPIVRAFLRRTKIPWTSF